ncbi:MAG: hypothetical protein RLZZ241_1372 [Bacteroidota bacterium]
MNEDEKELIAACLRRNNKAQMTLYNKYYKAMFNSAFRILKDKGLAEDVMQDSFLSAFERLNDFKGEATFGAWLKRIVINKSIYQYHKIQKRNEVPIAIDSFPETLDFTSTGTEEDFKRMTNTVLKVMESLPEAYRMILNLHLIEGYDYQEICSILGITYANCRTILSRAKAQLRKKLTFNGTYA